MSEYLSKEEIKKWRSSVEKITLEEYAARLGKKIQEEKKTNDLADMLYTRFNPAQSPANYDVVTKLEKIDLTPKLSSAKPKKQSSKMLDSFDDLDIDNDDLELDNFDVFDEENEPPMVKKEKAEKKPVSKKEPTVKKEKTEKKPVEKKEPIAKKEKAPAVKKEKAVAAPKKEINADFAKMNITFKKSLTDREEKVLAHFIEKRGEIVYAKDLAELLELKRDYIYKYIKNLRAKMTVDIIVNADNGGFKID